MLTVPTIYLGWDSREVAAYDVARASIRRRTADVWVRPLDLEGLERQGILTRPVERRGNQLWCPISDAPMATEFAISRFAVPFVHPSGWAVFMDCDVVCLADVRELFALADPKYAVMCVKRDMWVFPPNSTKMDGQLQTSYARKNWSSVVLWNCAHPANKRLTSEALNTWPGRDLHAFKWLEDHEIGELPKTWNSLVGVDEIETFEDWQNPLVTIGPHPDNCDVSPCINKHEVKLLHYTLGGPWLPGWQGGPLDDVWNREAGRVLETV